MTLTLLSLTSKMVRLWVGSYCSLGLVLRSERLSPSAVELSIHSEPYCRGRGWVLPTRWAKGTSPLQNQASTIDLTRFAEYSGNIPLNRVRPSGLGQKPSFEEKLGFRTNNFTKMTFQTGS